VINLIDFVNDFFFSTRFYSLSYPTFVFHRSKYPKNNVDFFLFSDHPTHSGNNVGINGIYFPVISGQSHISSSDSSSESEEVDSNNVEIPNIFGKLIIQNNYNFCFMEIFSINKTSINSLNSQVLFFTVFADNVNKGCKSCADSQGLITILRGYDGHHNFGIFLNRAYSAIKHLHPSGNIKPVYGYAAYGKRNLARA